MPKVIDLPTSTSMSDSDYFVMEASGGGTKKITRANALSPIGTVVSGTDVTSIVSSGVRTGVKSITLSKGVWVIIGNVRFNGQLAANTYIEAGIGLFSTGDPNWGTMAFSRAYVPTSITSPSVPTMATYNVTQQTTYYLVAAQNSGASQALDAGASSLRAVRIL